MAKKGDKFKKHSVEFKVKVAKAYISGKYGGLGAISKKYNINSKSRIKSWVEIYKEKGKDGFVNEARGRNKGGRPKKIKLEEMSLEQQVEYLKMENDILKKVKALLKN